MLNLASPTISAEEMYDAASERFLDQNLRERLREARPVYLESSADYSKKGATYSLHEIADGNPAEIKIPTLDLITLYDQGLLRRRSKARLLYEEIRLSTPHNICPYCNHRNVGQLDHFLAKSKFPILSVCPQNLVPSCADCNKIKRDRTYQSFTEAPLHPYFDYFEGIDWLVCKLEKTDGYWIAKFDIDSASLHANNVLKLVNHFTEFGLWELYSIQASAELARQSGLVEEFRKSGGAAAVRDYLEKSVRSFRAFSNNHWRTALARGCLDNAEFIEE
ncbi:HNH endonuclease [Porphyrobacter sp. AAP60]|uniref:HNH endonuclease n=1 Tax=Porphyrobacter sp. AAP60 TaxID=1523423 RepID=UPI000AB59335|nr:hypothetical protein [Porphyrobacter sp. AAP60]